MDESAIIKAVQSFVWEVHSIRRVLAAQPRGMTSVRAIVHAVHRGELPREGVLSDGTFYVVHGRGCRFEINENREIDVDIGDDGIEEFDPWRIMMCSSEIDSREVTVDAILETCRSFAVKFGIIEHREGWFHASESGV